MVIKGLSALAAGVAIFIAVIFSQPSPSNGSLPSELAVSVEPVTTSGSSGSAGSIGGLPESSSQLQAPTCKPAAQLANEKCYSGKTYDYTCTFGQEDKAHPGETCMLNASCSEVVSNTTFSGNCCGPLSCAMTKTPTTQVAGPPVAPAQAPPASNLTDTKSGTGQLPSTPSNNAPVNSTNSGPGQIPSAPANGTQPGTVLTNANGSNGTASNVSAPTNTTSTAPPGTGSGNVLNSGAGTIPSAPPQTVFSGNPSLSNPATAITPGGSPFSPPPNSSGYSSPTSNTNPYAPTSATFNGGKISGGQGYNSPTITAASPLTNFFSSVGNIVSLFSLVSSVFTPTDSAPTPTRTYVTVPVPVATPQSASQRPTQVIAPTQVVTTVSAGQAPQLSKDYFTGANTYQNPSWLQQPSSYIDLITGDQQTLSPIDIATIIQGSSQENNPTQGLIAQISANTPIQSLLEQEPIVALSGNSTINLQVPQISSLALNTVNGLENYRNVPEQFYIEEAQLAQAQSNYEWLQAQIAAWQNAEQVGVCDDACRNALSILKSEAPNQYEQVQQLQELVAAGPFANTATTSTSTTAVNNVVPVGTVQVPGAGQAQVVADNSSTLQTPVPSAGAPYYVKQNDEWCDQYEQCIPASAFQPEPVAQVVSTNPEFGSQTSTTSTPVDPFTLIAQTLEDWINNALAIVTPNTATSSTSQQSCSLFKSIFGGCGGSQ